MKTSITNQEVFADYAQAVEIYGQGCNYPTKTGVDGFQVDFDIDVETRAFHIVFQNEDRNDNIRGYGRFGMTTACKFGCDADESTRLAELLDWDDRYSQIIDDLSDRAAWLCREWAESVEVSDKDSMEYKLRNEIAGLEAKAIKEQADEKGLRVDGVWVMKQLKSKGWISKAYVPQDAITTDFHVTCGYSGGYNRCHLVKVF